MTTKEKILHIINVVLIVAVVILSVFLYKSCSAEPPAPVVITDTCVVTEFVDKIKYVTHYDTIVTYKFVPDSLNDTIEVKDTIHIPIEYKQSEFEIKKDSFEGKGIIHYHGFKSDIDSVNFDYSFTYTPPVEKKRKWHISLQAGYYTGYNLIDRKIFSGPGAGIGISYDLW